MAGPRGAPSVVDAEFPRLPRDAFGARRRLTCPHGLIRGEEVRNRKRAASRIQEVSRFCGSGYRSILAYQSSHEKLYPVGGQSLSATAEASRWWAGWPLGSSSWAGAKSQVFADDP